MWRTLRHLRPGGFETLAGARSSTTEPPNNRDGPTSRTQPPQPQDLDPPQLEGEGRRRDASATPRPRKPRLSLTLTDRPALSGLDYPLASLAARPPCTLRSTAHHQVVSRRSLALAPQPPNRQTNRDGPTSRTQRPQPQDLNPSGRKPNNSAGTPALPHAHGNHASR